MTRYLSVLSSSARGAQKQAIDCILDLSIDYSMARALMKQWGAVGVIERVEDVYLRFRTSKRHVDKLLLSSSRKALVSLDDLHINTLLYEWTIAEFPDVLLLGDDSESRLQKCTELWNRITPFLS